MIIKALYGLLNLITTAITGLALYSILHPEINARVVDFVGPHYANLEAPCGLFFGYLVLSLLATLVGIMALCVQGLETARFPFYCVALVWSPLIYLAILGGVLVLSGQLFWP